MNNYTNVETEFNQRMNNKLQKLRNLDPNPNRIQNELDRFIPVALAEMRKERLQKLYQITHRNIICYISAWLQNPHNNPGCQINDNDMSGLMNAVSGIENRKQGLDIILHTPGGVVTATESIVNYLRKMFNMDIRVIVPHMAMSAGTMIACASREIVMGKQSSLGPIDPQYHNVPAQGVLKEFERAIKETMQSPNKSLIWKEIIQQYRPTFVGECENVVKMSYDLVEGWLTDCMFKNAKHKEEKIKKILNELASHDASKVHDRHYDFVKCKELGLKVTPLEKDPALQDGVLSLYHCYSLSIYRMPNVLKFIENQNGQVLITSAVR